MAQLLTIASPHSPLSFPVVNKNDNDLLDLKNLSIDLNILSLGGKTSKSTTTTDKDYKCESDEGCCVKVSHGHGSDSCQSGYTFVDEGHNVYNYNDNDLLDLKGLTIDLNILSSGEKKTTTNKSYKAPKGGCCAKTSWDDATCKSGYTYINKGHNSE